MPRSQPILILANIGVLESRDYPLHINVLKKQQKDK